MTRRPPGAARTALLLARLHSRRLLHRMTAARRRKPKDGTRGATARKTTGSRVLLLFVGVVFVVQALFVSDQLLRRAADAVDPMTDRDAHGLFEPIPVAAAHLPQYETAFALVLATVFLAIVLSTLGSGSTELAQVGWSMEWMYQFPVRTQGLLLAKLGEYTLTNTFGWILLAPLLVCYYVGRGEGGAGVALGLAAAAAINVVACAARLSLETWMRKVLPLTRLKNAQALCTMAGLLAFFGVFFIAFREPFPAFVLATARALPAGALHNPVTQAAAGASGAVFAVAWAGAAGAGALAWCAWILRDGLLTGGGGPYQGSRTERARPARLRGVAGKEMRLLLRDRNFFVQTLVVPVFLVGFQAIVNPGLFASSDGGPVGAITAFAVGAYVLMFGAFSVLVVEKKSLWLLFTFPQRLADVLRRKVLLWAGVALLYGSAVLFWVWRLGPDPGPAQYAAPFLTLGGIVLFAFLAAGIGCLGTDPFEDLPQRRIKASWSYLYLILVSMYGFALYQDRLYFQLVFVGLVGLLAYAIWQKVHERLPLLLDPTQAPAPRVSLADGLIATVLFFVLQSIFAIGFTAAEITGFALQTSAFLCAGAATMAIVLYVLWRTRVPAVRRTLGYAGGAGAARVSAWGVGFGLLAAGVGVAYVSLAQEWPVLREALDGMRAMRPRSVTDQLALVLLTVVAAPVFEEFIFRGLVYRGLRRTLGVTASVLGSAFIFAAVHPPVSAAPVFVMGALAAWSAERTGSLWTPMLVHAVYNASILTLS